MAAEDSWREVSRGGCNGTYVTRHLPNSQRRAPERGHFTHVKERVTITWVQGQLRGDRWGPDFLGVTTTWYIHTDAEFQGRTPETWLMS